MGASRQWLPPGEWPTILAFLAARHPRIGAATWAARMAHGVVLDEQGRPINPETTYRPGACVFYYRELEAEEDIPFAEHILYRDEHLLAVDKPHFLPVMPAGRFLRETLLARLKKSENLVDLVPLHRIDRETAGVVLFSLDPATRGAYAALFMRRLVKKIYEALAPREASLRFPHVRRSRIVAGEPFFRVKEIEGPPNSETLIEMAATAGDTALYRATPVTGKKHQLRIHFSALGIPIHNDRVYPEILDSADDYSKPLKLLARSIGFSDPVTGREQYFVSERTLS